MSKNVLGGTIETNSYEELEKMFNEYLEQKSSKQYPVKLSNEELQFVTMEFLPNLEWVSQSVYDVEAIVNLVNRMSGDLEVNAEKEEIKALFHFLVNSKNTGTNNIFTIKSILTNFSVVLREIGQDEQDIRDAGFELQAAEQGILPEELANRTNGEG